MPLMVDIRRAVVFGGERGEGLQKTQKLALFADELLVVPETPQSFSTIELPQGRLSELGENLRLPQARSIPVHFLAAQNANLDELIRGASFVTSDLSDRSLNEKIVEIASTHHVLCNIIDTRDLCNTWFMSLVESPHLIGGWSTKATATFYVTRLRHELESRLPRWEREAAFTAELRALLVPSRRKKVLAQVWKSRWIRVLLRFRGPQSALKAAIHRFSKEILP